MDYVYVLHHSYELDDEDEVKLIGVFSSKSKAKSAISFLQDKEGFKEHPVDCFIIDKYKIDGINWAEGFLTMYTT